MNENRSLAEEIIDLDIADLRARGVSDFDIVVVLYTRMGRVQAALLPEDDVRCIRVATGMAALSVRKAMLD